MSSQKLVNKSVKRARARKPTLLIIGIVMVTSTILLTLSAAVILFANGLRPGDSGFVQTGNLRVNPDPANVQVFLNGEERSLVNGIVSGLIPGNYTLTVTADNYVPWEKKITINPGLLEEVAVRLFPKNRKLTRFTRSNIEYMVFAQTDEYIYYVVRQASQIEEQGIWRQRITLSSPFNLFSADKVRLTDGSSQIFQNLQKGEYKLLPSPDNRRLLLTVSKPTVEQYILDADSLNDFADLAKLSSKLGFAVLDSEWLGNSDQLLVFTENLLSAYDLNRNQSTIVQYSTSSRPQYQVSENRVYMINKAGDKIEFFENGTVQELILGKLSLNGKLTKLYVGKANLQNIYYTNDRNETYFINIQKQFQYQLPKDIILQAISGNGSAAVFQGSLGGDLTVMVANELKAFGALEVRLNTISRLVNPNLVTFSGSGTQVIVLADDSSLYIGDRDGSNLLKIAETDLGINAGQYGINNSATEVYLLILDSTVNQNIYTISLRPN